LEWDVTNSIPELPIAELVATIARALVDNPAGVSVEETSAGFGSMLHLRVDAADVGKLIGKQGRTARSLRTILAAVSVKLGRQFSLEIVEDAEPTSTAPH
jgi:hypothetical protein